MNGESLKPFNVALAQRPKQILFLCGTTLSKTFLLYVRNILLVYLAWVDKVSLNFLVYLPLKSIVQLYKSHL